MHSRAKDQHVSTIVPSVLFAPRLASLSSSSVHAPTHILYFATTKHTLLHALMYLFPDHHPMLKNVRSSHFLRVYYTPLGTFPVILSTFGTRSHTFISPHCFRRVRASRSSPAHSHTLPQTPSPHISHTFTQRLAFFVIFHINSLVFNSFYNTSFITL